MKWFGLHIALGSQVAQELKHLGQTRDLPNVIRSDDGKATLNFARSYDVELRLNKPGKPNQNARIESFNDRFCDECLNEHWFLILSHARRLIEQWRLEYNNERPEKALDGITPAA